MFNFLFVPGFLLHNFITFGLNKWLEPKTTLSLSIMTNSLIVSGGSYLYLNNIITPQAQINLFQTTIGFFINEFMFKRFHKLDNDFLAKGIHHILAMIAIYKFNTIPQFIASLFLTEISNIPLELRNIARTYQFNRFYLQPILIGSFYFTYTYYRIYLSPFEAWNYYQQNIITDTELFSYGCIYTLWLYWFYKINYIIYKKTQKYLKNN